MSWTRPLTAPSGRIWRSFEKNGRSFYITDVDEKDIEKCIEFGEKWFLRDEPLSKCLGVLSDPQSVDSIRANWRSFLAQGCSLACYAEPRELVGLAICPVRSRGDSEGDFRQEKGDPWRKLLSTLIEIESSADVFAALGVPRYLSWDVLAVAGAWRGRGLGAQLLAAGESLASSLDLPAIAAVATAAPAQAILSRCGYSVLSEIRYSQICGVDYTTCVSDRAQVLAKRVESVDSMPQGIS